MSTEMRGCLTCGVKQSGFKEFNDEWVSVYGRFIETCGMAKDSKSLVFIINKLCNRISTSVTQYTGDHEKTGDLCLDPYITKRVTKLIATASELLASIESKKENYSKERF